MPPEIRAPLSLEEPSAVIKGQHRHSFFHNCPIFNPKPPQLSHQSIRSDLARAHGAIIRQIRYSGGFRGGGQETLAPAPAGYCPISQVTRSGKVRVCEARPPDPLPPPVHGFMKNIPPPVRNAVRHVSNY